MLIECKQKLYSFATLVSEYTQCSPGDKGLVRQVVHACDNHKDVVMFWLSQFSTTTH